MEHKRSRTSEETEGGWRKIHRLVEKQSANNEACKTKVEELKKNARENDELIASKDETILKLVKEQSAKDEASKVEIESLKKKNEDMLELFASINKQICSNVKVESAKKQQEPNDPLNEGVREKRVRVTTHTPETPETEYIKLKVVDEDLNEIHFRVKQTTQMGKLMKAYSERSGVCLLSIRFLFDGRRIQYDETPKELEMKQDDIIESELCYPDTGYRNASGQTNLRPAGPQKKL